MNRNIIFLTCQDLSDFDDPISPVFWKTIKGYQNAGWKVFIINAFKDNHARIDISGYYYREFKVPFNKAAQIKKIGYIFRLIKVFLLNSEYTKLAEKVICDHGLNTSETVIYGYEVWGVKAAKKVCQKHHIPLVTRFQGTELYRVSYSFMNYLRYFPHLTALGTKADIVIMTNDGTRGDEVLKKLKNSSGRIFFWRNGVDDVQESDRKPPDFVKGIKQNEKIIMTLSRLSGWKRVDRAITAFAEVVKQYPDCKLVIVGYGEAEEQLKAQAKELNIHDKVIFTGGIPHKMVYSHISQADVFLSLYDISNVGNPLLEAMRCGKPIITLDVGNTSEIIRNETNGILLKVSEIDKIPQCIVKVLTDQSFAENLTRGALDYAKKNLWTWNERISKEVEEVSKLI